MSDNDINFQLSDKGGVVLNFDNSDSRRAVEHCFRTTSTMINPILNWTDSDVWEFLHHYGCTGNPLYQCGFDRIGCIGCPLADYRTMRNEFKRYPKYMQMYINAFSKMLVEREKTGRFNYSWHSGKDVFNWWINIDENQLTFDGFDLLDV
jgi:phosphoadenosine phosphosulfate reductase